MQKEAREGGKQAGRKGRFTFLTHMRSLNFSRMPQVRVTPARSIRGSVLPINTHHVSRGSETLKPTPVRTTEERATCLSDQQGSQDETTPQLLTQHLSSVLRPRQETGPILAASSETELTQGISRGRRVRSEAECFRASRGESCPPLRKREGSLRA